MRYRSEILPAVNVSGPCYYVYCYGGTSNPFYTWSLTGPAGVRSITDEVGSNSINCGRTSRARMLPVSHNVTQYTLSGNPWVVPTPNACIPYVKYGIRETVYPPGGTFLGVSRWWNPSSPEAVFVAGAGLTFGPPSGLSIATGHYDRWLKAKPTMATRASMSIFLAELRDIKRMWDIFPSKHFRLRDWKEVLKFANGLHLNWNFGWKPFLRDIYACWEGLTSFEKRLASFIDNADLDLIRHARDVGEEETSVGLWTGLNVANFLIRPTATRSITRASTFQFSYSLPQYDYETLRWRAYMDTLGLTASASDVWELVPWSFVVDWFANVGAFLESTENDWIAPWLWFCQCCSSYKVKYELTFDLKYVPYNAYNYGIASWQYTSYNRGNGIPAHADLQTPALSLDKIRLLASLAAQQVL